MGKTIPRKTDRRTLYTKMVIKDALLKLMEDRGFEQITVTAIYKEADVTRTTFYQHFDHLTAVLDETLTEALKTAEGNSANPNEDLFHMLRLIADGERNPEKLQECDALLPVCQRAANLPKYRVLFLDESLSGYILKKLLQTQKEKMVPLLMRRANLPQKEAEMLFVFILHGSFSVNKTLKWEKNRTWYEIQGALLRFMLGGMDALR